jgi:hypothetical protein
MKPKLKSPPKLRLVKTKPTISELLLTASGAETSPDRRGFLRAVALAFPDLTVVDIEYMLPTLYRVIGSKATKAQ